MRTGLSVSRFAWLAACAVVFATSVQAQDSRTRLGLKLSGDQPIQIESDKLDVNEAEAKAIFAGNVSVVQGTTMLKAMKMTVYYEKAADGKRTSTGATKIDRLEVDGKVYLKSESQEATGDRGTFDMKSEVLTLQGKQVVLSEGPNVLIGCQLTVFMKTGESKFDACGGRIKTVLTPGSNSASN